MIKEKRYFIWTAVIFAVAVIILYSCHGGQNKSKGKYAIIMKSRDNWYSELACQGYRQVVEEAGESCVILYPENASAQEQIRLIRSLMKDKVKAIAVAANDEYALVPVLSEARARGISVITLDADTEAGGRSIYIKPVDAKQLGQVLAMAVLDSCGGSGQWAILSAGSRSANQNEWIYMMKKELGEKPYRNLRLVDIVFGEGQHDKAASEAGRLLDTYPDLEVICSLSTEGIKAASQVVKERGMEQKVKVIGLGLPDQMEMYVGHGEVDVCPVMYIWNPTEMGKLAAYVSIELARERIEERGEQTLMLGGQAYKMDYGMDGGLEVIAGEPIRVDKENIGYWKEQL